MGYHLRPTTAHLQPRQPAAAHRSFFAAGFAGQLIQVIPDLDLVVVLTSNIDQERYDAEFLVGETIIPAVTD